MLLGMYLTIYHNIVAVSNNKSADDIMRRKATYKIIYKVVKNTVIVTLLFSMGVQTTVFALQNHELKNRIILLTSDD